MTQPIRVVKVGGSLFQLPTLRQQLHRWLASQPPAVQLLVAGGGLWVDAVRDADGRFELGASASHWLSIQAMSSSARLLAQLLGCPVLFDQDQWRQQPLPTVCVADVHKFMLADRSRPDALPEGWQVTSDSIAARVAATLGADLVLLKRVAFQGDLNDAARRGIVDGWFPQAAKGTGTVRIEKLS